MSYQDRRKGLNWRRVFTLATIPAAIVLAAFGATALPLVSKKMAELDAERVETIYASGLAPCPRHSMNIDLLLKSYLPAAPSASITVFPSFSATVAIRLVGQDLYFFELDFPLFEVGDKPSVTLNAGGVPSIYHSRVSSEIARQLPLVLGSDIKNARATFPEGLDGTSYFFQDSSEGCAMTWSPHADTRAGRFVELFDQLVKHAKAANASELATNEEAILASLKALQQN